MKPFYHDESAGITIYHGDCRSELAAKRLAQGVFAFQ